VNTIRDKFHLKAWRSTGWLIVLASLFGLVSIWFLLNLVIAGKCDQKCVIDTLAQTLRVATPIVFAALCGVMCERSGVINIGIEGMMLMSAMVGYAVNLFAFQWLKELIGVEPAGSLSRLLAVLLGVLAAVILAWLHANISIRSTRHFFSHCASLSLD